MALSTILWLSVGIPVGYFMVVGLILVLYLDITERFLTEASEVDGIDTGTILVIAFWPFILLIVFGGVIGMLLLGLYDLAQWVWESLRRRPKTNREKNECTCGHCKIHPRPIEGEEIEQKDWNE